MKKQFYILVFCFGLHTVCTSCYAGWTNVMRNYTREDYRAGSQNWQSMQQNGHWMYFANKSGVLEYSGNSWKLYTLHNQTDVRAIQGSKNKIYLGGLNEFGYLEPKTTGELNYVCLSDSLASDRRYFGNIWYIYETSQSLYFIADNVIIHYTDNTPSIIRTPEKVTFANLINQALYIATDAGIYAFIGRQFYKIPYSEGLSGKKIRSILPFDKQLLIATAFDGLFLLNEKGLIRKSTEADRFIRENELFSVAMNTEYIAIGTVLNGLALLDRDGRIIKYFNETNGLQNNTVLHVMFDSHSNIWLGLDNGVSYIMLNSPVSNLYSERNFYGAGYAAALYDQKLYLATNRGLYWSHYPVPVSENTQLSLIGGSQGQIWDLNLIGGELFCCSDKGLFQLKNNHLQAIDRKTGVWSVMPVMNDKNKIWVSTYDGFYVFEKQNGQWEKMDYVYGYPGSAINYTEISPRVLWIRTGRNELLKIEVNEAYNKVDAYQHYTPQNGAPEDSYVFKAENRLLFGSPSGIYGFNEKTQSFTLNTDFNIEGQIYQAMWENGDARWYLGPLHIRKTTKSQTSLYAHNLPLIKDFQRLTFLNENDVIICNENGFALWESNVAHRNEVRESVAINKVSISTTGDSLIYVDNFLGRKTVPEIAYKHNTIRFQYGLASFDKNSSSLYRYKLDDAAWSEPTASVVKEYSHLPEGQHHFVVEALLENGQTIADEFDFIILSPWYRTIWAYLAYGLLLIIALLCVWQWDDRRIKTLYRQEQEQKEQEIIALKNEHLELEVKHKSQELANTAINLANKNEILMEIKSDLQKISDDLNASKTTDARRSIVRINTKIDENISHDDNLKKFEEHFDLVHNNFIKKISEKHPSLSLNERKMCAFIKMQLASKEIAPLLNISVRGAETLRYRLRKKFGLNREDSLTAFLNQI